MDGLNEEKEMVNKVRIIVYKHNFSNVRKFV